MDELKEIKERMDNVTNLEWVAGNIKSEDVYWLIEKVEQQQKKIERMMELINTFDENLTKEIEQEREVSGEGDEFQDGITTGLESAKSTFLTTLYQEVIRL